MCCQVSRQLLLMSVLLMSVCVDGMAAFFVLEKSERANLENILGSRKASRNPFSHE